MVQTVLELPQLRAAQVRGGLNFLRHSKPWIKAVQEYASICEGEDLWSLSCWSWPQRGNCGAA